MLGFGFGSTDQAAPGRLLRGGAGGPPPPPPVALLTLGGVPLTLAGLDLTFTR